MTYGGQSVVGGSGANAYLYQVPALINTVNKHRCPALVVVKHNGIPSTTNLSRPVNGRHCHQGLSAPRHFDVLLNTLNLFGLRYGDFRSVLHGSPAIKRL